MGTTCWRGRTGTTSSGSGDGCGVTHLGGVDGTFTLGRRQTWMGPPAWDGAQGPRPPRGGWDHPAEGGMDGTTCPGRVGSRMRNDGPLWERGVTGMMVGRGG